MAEINTVIKVFDAGSVIKIWAYIKDEDGAYFDPTSAKLTLYDKDNTKILDAVTMTKSVVGKYYYIWQSTIAMKSGIYRGMCDAVSGSYTAKKTVGIFYLEEGA